jgi:hypothetical protein
MASSQPVQNRIQKVLDPTKIATWNIVRRPPVPNHSVIQGKPRQEGSNAFKEFQRQEGARLRKALNRITHGKNIFAYNNIRTNQVVYSLTRYLEVCSLSRVNGYLRWLIRSEKQCAVTNGLPWQEDRSRVSPKRHVGSLLLRPFQ